MSNNLRFPSSERLKSRKIIDTLFTEGHTFFVYPLRVHLLSEMPGDQGSLQIVFSVPKRKFRKAVDRNLIRRRIREAWRLHRRVLIDHPDMSQTKLWIMLTFTGKVDDISYERIVMAVKKIIHKCLPVRQEN